MTHLQLYESYGEIKYTLTSRQGRKLIFDAKYGKIENIDNQSGIRFPFSVGQSFNMSIKTWACNNGFTWQENNSPASDPCPEKKIFGVRAKDVPQGHEWRILFPNKFR